jgi:hypothetical protein
MVRTVKVNEAAVSVLQYEKQPLNSKEIARRAIDQGLVSSTAKDPVASIAQTLEKNIRGEIYNHPKLVFISSPRGRLVGLPSMNGEVSALSGAPSHQQTVALKLPIDLIERIQLASHAKIANSFDDTIVLLIKKGLVAVAADVRRGLTMQLNKLDEL